MADAESVVAKGASPIAFEAVALADRGPMAVMLSAGAMAVAPLASVTVRTALNVPPEV